VLVSLTRWATEAAAKEFAGLYAGSLVKRYRSVAEVTAPRDGSGEWKTEEGPVEISAAGPFVIAIEGLAGEERTQVRQALEHTFIAEPHPARTASPPSQLFPLEPIITTSRGIFQQPQGH
jgi:hypothetical protein